MRTSLPPQMTQISDWISRVVHKLFRFFCLNPLSRWSTNQMSHEHTRYRIVTERSNLISVFSQMLPCDRIAVEMNEEVFLCYFFAAPLIHAISIEHSVSLNESLCVCVCRMYKICPFAHATKGSILRHHSSQILPMYKIRSLNFRHTFSVPLSHCRSQRAQDTDTIAHLTQTGDRNQSRDEMNERVQSTGRRKKKSISNTKTANNNQTDHLQVMFLHSLSRISNVFRSLASSN